MANHYTFGIGQPHTEVEDEMPPVLYDETTQSLVSGDRKMGGYFARDWQDLQEAAAASVAGSRIGMVHLTSAATYEMESTISVNLACMGIEGNGAILSDSRDDGTNCLRLTNTLAVPAGANQYRTKLHSIGGFEMAGPGAAATAKVGLVLDSDTAGMGPRASIRNVYIHGFPVLVDMQDQGYLANFHDCEFYDALIAYRQSAGSDAGENVRFSGANIIHSTDLAFHLIDNTSEVFFEGSIDYIKQLCVITGAPSRLFISGHVEPRGANLVADDGNYVVNGSGTDPRAVISGKDSFVDIDGNGSLVVIDGWFDINNSGGVAPYAYDHLVNVRHANSKFILRGSAQNWLNTANRWWVGAGRAFTEKLHTQNTPAMPSRGTTVAAGNCLFDPQIATNIRDQWCLFRDGAAITNRLTGTNGNITRTNVVTDGNNGALTITKTGAASAPFRVAAFVAAARGDRFSAFLRAHRVAGFTGNIFISLHWGCMTGYDGNGIPVFGDPSTGSPFTLGSAFSTLFADTTLTATTGSYLDVTIPLVQSGTSSDESCPEWATHCILQINADAPGAGVLHLDNMVITRW